MKQSFRQQFAPIIASVIRANRGASAVDIRRALRAAWRHNVKTESNAYMHSEWSREVGRQLATHPDKQQTLSDLPLFEMEER